MEWYSITVCPIPGLSVAGGFKLIVEDRAGLGVDNLQKQTDALIGKLQSQPGLTSVSTVFRSNVPQLFLDIDRKKVASLRVSFDDLNKTLGIYLGSLYVNSFNEFGRYWQVNLQGEGQFRSQIDDIHLLYVRNNQGLMVPLGTLVNAPRSAARSSSSVTTSTLPRPLLGPCCREPVPARPLPIWTPWPTRRCRARWAPSGPS